MKKIKLFVLLLLANFGVLAQNKSTINGRVLDKGQPVEFANVTLSRISDSTKVAFVAVTDTLGKFRFSKVENCEFIMRFTMLGYQTSSQRIVVNGQSDVLNLGDIYLKPDNQLLGEIVVTSSKPVLEKTNEGFVVNASTNISQAGGTVTDLLKSTPTIGVDADGGITLRGKTPLILVNGRNSKLSNTDQIPASSVERIEVINNANAKYDANAQSGIINIILKKNVQYGTSGSVAAGGGFGSRARGNSSLLLSHYSNKWNMDLAYDNRFAGRTKHIGTDRTNFNDVESHFINQDRNDERVERLQNLKLNLGFQLNKFNGFNFEAIGNLQGQDNDESLKSIVSKQNNNFNYANNRHSLEYRRSKVLDLAFNYQRSFDDKNKLLKITLSTSLESGKENTDINTIQLNESGSNFGDYSYQKTHNYENDAISNIIIDYATPLGTSMIFETGYKGTYRHVKNDYLTSNLQDNSYIVNPTGTNIFSFDEQINAGYGLVRSNNSASKWNYEAGLRLEAVNNNGQNLDNSSKFNNNYIKLFPTVNIGYSISKEQALHLTYSKRINRPNLGDLNPFVDITDALNPHSGNPFLQPEIIHNSDLSYNIEGKNNSFVASLFYRYSLNSIRQFFEPLANGAVLMKPMNIGTAYNYGFESIFSAKPLNNYDLNASVTLYEQSFNADNISNDAVNNSLNLVGKLINNYSLGKNVKFQLIGNYTSPATTPQGKLSPLYFVDLGYQQKLGKGNAKLGFVFVDIFNTLQSGVSNINSTFVSNRTQKADTRAFMITFAYSFKSSLKDKLLENKFSKEF